LLVTQGFPIDPGGRLEAELGGNFIAAQVDDHDHFVLLVEMMTDNTQVFQDRLPGDWHDWWKQPGTGQYRRYSKSDQHILSSDCEAR